ncbi:DUF2927 domain-containing protein [Octadecabacter sp. CECT 8868]|uniref:DUF2927 domain-containing protein n=1 Tax=Octadecabacter algicola TaxID=2909342 RepID=UPI001F20FDD4|nr:DUF2927 domain-containing protein [Octadecabacter algicola]MCF2904577.1 DUF2927 domain-containing protein [Octadecabacter algicola]
MASGITAISMGLTALLVLAACEPAVPALPPVAPQERPNNLVPPVEPPAPAIRPQPSDASRALSVYYKRQENDLIAIGSLRSDGGGPDTMFTAAELARNFVRIALFDEYATTPTGLRAQPTISRLRRWEQPVRFTVQFGNTVPDDQRMEDSQNIRNYVSRLERVTNYPMSMDDTDPNFHVLILNEDDRLGFETQLRALVPGINATSVRAFIDVPRDTSCLVLAFSVDNSPEYSKAIAMIRGEHPDLIRLACIHEELAQGLGLANDSPQARPSIFNDDEEFGLLTTHDELLLKMLYDDRFETGMSAAEAAPIARVIATEMLNNGPS